VEMEQDARLILTVLLITIATSSISVSQAPQEHKEMVLDAKLILIVPQITIATSSTSVFQVPPEKMAQSQMIGVLPMDLAQLVSTAMNSNSAFQELPQSTWKEDARKILTVKLTTTATSSISAFQVPPEKLNQSPTTNVLLMDHAPLDIIVTNSTSAFQALPQSTWMEDAKLILIALLIITVMSSTSAFQVPQELKLMEQDAKPTLTVPQTTTVTNSTSVSQEPQEKTAQFPTENATLMAHAQQANTAMNSSIALMVQPSFSE
jgi:hypothetical protein